MEFLTPFIYLIFLYMNNVNTIRDLEDIIARSIQDGWSAINDNGYNYWKSPFVENYNPGVQRCLNRLLELAEMNAEDETLEDWMLIRFNEDRLGWTTDFCGTPEQIEQMKKIYELREKLETEVTV